MIGKPGGPEQMDGASFSGGPRPSAAPTIGEMSGFMGFAGIPEEDEVDTNDWFLKKDDHTVLGDAYKNVRIFMTKRDYGAPQQWCDTEMKGVLKVV
jgi:hypothetical protein